MAILKNVTINNPTGFVKIADGNGSSRPAGSTGMVRFNSSRSEIETYDNSSWTALNSIRNNEVTTGRVLDLDGS
jgi:hypothetical protein